MQKVVDEYVGFETLEDKLRPEGMPIEDFLSLAETGGSPYEFLKTILSTSIIQLEPLGTWKRT